ncbi:MAG: hypothetical protein CMN57_01120 [Gammaproteobacteria bacterium]|nr:hypothetical protein [Gammaproteobacteria bacterium]
MENQLPSGWTEFLLSETGEWLGGGTPSKSNPAYWNGSIPWVSPKDMKKASIENTEDFITPAAIEESSVKLIPEGAVLFVTRSGILAHSFPVATTKKRVTVNQDLKAIVPVPAIDPEFLAWYLRANTRAILNSCTKYGTTVHSIEVPSLKSWAIAVPPVNEQQRIVARIEALFSELDKGIEALKTAREQLKVYRQAVLKHAFEGRLTAQWREENKDRLESPEQLLARIQQPEQPRGGRQASKEVIEGIAALAVNKPKKVPPKGWTWVPLLRIARQETGHTPSRKYPEYWDGDQYWIGIADARLHHGKKISDTLQKVTLKGLDNSSARTLPKDTVCLSRTASVGYVCIMGRPMATSQDFATWTCTEAIDPKFLMYAFMAEGNEIRRFGKGTTHTTIYFPEIRALHICLPSPQEQKVIVDSVESKLQQIDTINAEIETQLSRAETLRQSILRKAFTGQLVPQDPNDEPASVLLERIRAEKAQQTQPTRGTRRKKTA